MFQDFKELLFALNAHSVKYLIVGGYAVSFHAQPRATKDLDILISADEENSKAVPLRHRHRRSSGTRLSCHHVRPDLGQGRQRPNG